MRRIYIGTESFRKKDFFYIKGETYHYLKNVLRLKVKDIFEGFDGTGKEYKIEILKIGKNEITGKIVEEKELYSTELPFYLNLFQCIPKGEKFDFIIREATQLGVNKIVPVISKRVIVKIDKEKIKNKLRRWQKIAEESAKVSGRTFVPEIKELVKFEECIKEEKDFGLIFWEGERDFTIKDFIKEIKGKEIKGKKINIFIGPEGGFDEEEIELAKKNNFFTLSLGKRILKVETASVVAIGILIYELENL
jgi:16S rRNA (uracil1498-N3)-methyltransferase